MQLYDVQRAALNARRNPNGSVAHGFGYFMEQGLGKTLTSYADFSELLAERLATRLIVVCPQSFKSGWQDDAEKHGLDFDFFIWTAGSEKYFESWCRRGFKKPPVLVVNWEAIRAKKKPRGKTYTWEEGKLTRLIWEHFIKPVGSGRVMAVFDESIQASTHNAAQTKGAMYLAGSILPYGYTRILSGKPIKQGPHDMWSQMRLIGKLEDMEYYPFKTAFCKMGGFKNKQVMGVQNEKLMTPLIEPYVFRATKADWTDLPPKVYTYREYTLTPEMRAMYDSMYNDFVLWLNEEEVVTVDAALTKYIKLAQIQCGWIYDEDGKVRQLVDDAKNPRLNLLKEIISDEVVGKVVVPYNHKPVFDQLLRNLGGENEVAWIKGQMDPQDVSEQKRRFNEDPKVRVILLQTRAAKYGHTLLGDQSSIFDRCNTMIPYENTYSLDDRSQIEDRTHRHGQLAETMLYVDLVGTSMDKNCVRALQRKEDVFQTVFAPLRTRRR